MLSSPISTHCPWSTPGSGVTAPPPPPPPPPLGWLNVIITDLHTLSMVHAWLWCYCPPPPPPPPPPLGWLNVIITDLHTLSMVHAWLWCCCPPLPLSPGVVKCYQGTLISTPCPWSTPGSGVTVPPPPPPPLGWINVIKGH